MIINGIRNTSTSDALSALSTLNNASSPDASAEALETASTPAASTTVSKPGELMSKPSQLLQQDPAQFKAVTQQIAGEPKSAAQGASGPQASLFPQARGQLHAGLERRQLVFAPADSRPERRRLGPSSSSRWRTRWGGAGAGIGALLSTAP